MLPRPKVNLFWFFDRIVQISYLNSQNDETNIPREGQSVIKNMGGGWPNSLESRILVGKRYFGVLKKLIWTTRGS